MRSRGIEKFRYGFLRLELHDRMTCLALAELVPKLPMWWTSFCDIFTTLLFYFTFFDSELKGLPLAPFGDSATVVPAAVINFIRAFAGPSVHDTTMGAMLYFMYKYAIIVWAFVLLCLVTLPNLTADNRVNWALILAWALPVIKTIVMSLLMASVWVIHSFYRIYTGAISDDPREISALAMWLHLVAATLFMLSGLILIPRITYLLAFRSSSADTSPVARSGRPSFSRGRDTGSSTHQDGMDTTSVGMVSESGGLSTARTAAESDTRQMFAKDIVGSHDRCRLFEVDQPYPLLQLPQLAGQMVQLCVAGCGGPAVLVGLPFNLFMLIVLMQTPVPGTGVFPTSIHRSAPRALYTMLFIHMVPILHVLLYMIAALVGKDTDGVLFYTACASPRNFAKEADYLSVLGMGNALHTLGVIGDAAMNVYSKVYSGNYHSVIDAIQYAIGSEVCIRGRMNAVIYLFVAMCISILITFFAIVRVERKIIRARSLVSDILSTLYVTAPQLFIEIKWLRTDRALNRHGRVDDPTMLATDRLSVEPRPRTAEEPIRHTGAWDEHPNAFEMRNMGFLPHRLGNLDMEESQSTIQERFRVAETILQQQQRASSRWRPISSGAVRSHHHSAHINTLYSRVTSDSTIDSILAMSRHVSSTSLVDQGSLISMLMMFDLRPGSYEFSAIVALIQAIIMSNTKYADLLHSPLLLDAGSQPFHPIVRLLCLTAAMTLPAAPRLFNFSKWFSSNDPLSERVTGREESLSADGLASPVSDIRLPLTAQAALSSETISSNGLSPSTEHSATVSSGATAYVPIYRRMIQTAAENHIKKQLKVNDLLVTPDTVSKYLLAFNDRASFISRLCYVDLYERHFGVLLSRDVYSQFTFGQFSDEDQVNVTHSAVVLGNKPLVLRIVLAVLLILFSPFILLPAYMIRRSCIFIVHLLACEVAELVAEVSSIAVSMQGGVDKCFIYTPATDAVIDHLKKIHPNADFDGIRQRVCAERGLAPPNRCSFDRCTCNSTVCVASNIDIFDDPHIGGLELVPQSPDESAHRISSCFTMLYGRRRAADIMIVLGIPQQLSRHARSDPFRADSMAVNPQIGRDMRSPLTSGAFSALALTLYRHIPRPVSPRLAAWTMQNVALGIRQLSHTNNWLMKCLWNVTGLSFHYNLTDSTIFAALEDAAAASHCSHVNSTAILRADFGSCPAPRPTTDATSTSSHSSMYRMRQMNIRMRLQVPEIFPSLQPGLIDMTLPTENSAADVGVAACAEEESIRLMDYVSQMMESEPLSLVTSSIFTYAAFFPYATLITREFGPRVQSSKGAQAGQNVSFAQPRPLPDLETVFERLIIGDLTMPMITHTRLFSFVHPVTDCGVRFLGIAERMLVDAGRLIRQSHTIYANQHADDIVRTVEDLNALRGDKINNEWRLRFPLHLGNVAADYQQTGEHWCNSSVLTRDFTNRGIFSRQHDRGSPLVSNRPSTDTSTTATESTAVYVNAEINIENLQRTISNQAEAYTTFTSMSVTFFRHLNLISFHRMPVFPAAINLCTQITSKQHQPNIPTHRISILPMQRRFADAQTQLIIAAAAVPLHQQDSTVLDPQITMRFEAVQIIYVIFVGAWVAMVLLLSGFYPLWSFRVITSASNVAAAGLAAAPVHEAAMMHSVSAIRQHPIMYTDRYPHVHRSGEQAFWETITENLDKNDPMSRFIRKLPDASQLVTFNDSILRVSTTTKQMEWIFTTLMGKQQAIGVFPLFKSLFLAQIEGYNSSVTLQTQAFLDVAGTTQIRDACITRAGAARAGNWLSYAAMTIRGPAISLSTLAAELPKHILNSITPYFAIEQVLNTVQQPAPSASHFVNSAISYSSAFVGLSWLSMFFTSNAADILLNSAVLFILTTVVMLVFIVISYIIYSTLLRATHAVIRDFIGQRVLGISIANAAVEASHRLREFTAPPVNLSARPGVAMTLTAGTFYTVGNVVGNETPTSSARLTLSTQNSRHRTGSPELSVNFNSHVVEVADTVSHSPMFERSVSLHPLGVSQRPFTDQVAELAPADGPTQMSRHFLGMRVPDWAHDSSSDYSSSGSQQRSSFDQPQSIFLVNPSLTEGHSVSPKVHRIITDQMLSSTDEYSQHDHSITDVALHIVAGEDTNSARTARVSSGSGSGYINDDMPFMPIQMRLPLSDINSTSYNQLQIMRHQRAGSESSNGMLPWNSDPDHNSGIEQLEGRPRERAAGGRLSQMTVRTASLPTMQVAALTIAIITALTSVLLIVIMCLRTFQLDVSAVVVLDDTKFNEAIHEIPTGNAYRTSLIDIVPVIYAQENYILTIHDILSSVARLDAATAQIFFSLEHEGDATVDIPLRNTEYLKAAKKWDTAFSDAWSHIHKLTVSTSSITRLHDHPQISSSASSLVSFTTAYLRLLAIHRHYIDTAFGFLGVPNYVNPMSYLGYNQFSDGIAPLLINHGTTRYGGTGTSPLAGFNFDLLSDTNDADIAVLRQTILDTLRPVAYSETIIDNFIAEFKPNVAQRIPMISHTGLLGSMLRFDLQDSATTLSHTVISSLTSMVNSLSGIVFTENVRSVGMDIFAFLLPLAILLLSLCAIYALVDHIPLIRPVTIIFVVLTIASVLMITVATLILAMASEIITHSVVRGAGITATAIPGAGVSLSLPPAALYAYLLKTEDSPTVEYKRSPQADQLMRQTVTRALAAVANMNYIIVSQNRESALRYTPWQSISYRVFDPSDHLSTVRDLAIMGLVDTKSKTHSTLDLLINIVTQQRGWVPELSYKPARSGDIMFTELDIVPADQPYRNEIIYDHSNTALASQRKLIENATYISHYAYSLVRPLSCFMHFLRALGISLALAASFGQFIWCIISFLTLRDIPNPLLRAHLHVVRVLHNSAVAHEQQRKAYEQHKSLPAEQLRAIRQTGTTQGLNPDIQLMQPLPLPDTSDKEHTTQAVPVFEYMVGPSLDILGVLNAPIVDTKSTFTPPKRKPWLRRRARRQFIESTNGLKIDESDCDLFNQVQMPRQPTTEEGGSNHHQAADMSVATRLLATGIVNAPSMVVLDGKGAHTVHCDSQNTAPDRATQLVATAIKRLFAVRVQRLSLSHEICTEGNAIVCRRLTNFVVCFLLPLALVAFQLLRMNDIFGAMTLNSQVMLMPYLTNTSLLAETTRGVFYVQTLNYANTIADYVTKSNQANMAALLRQSTNTAFYSSEIELHLRRRIIDDGIALGQLSFKPNTEPYSYYTCVEASKDDRKTASDETAPRLIEDLVCSESYSLNFHRTRLMNAIATSFFIMQIINIDSVVHGMISLYLCQLLLNLCVLFYGYKVAFHRFRKLA